jgi:hypothetical protein
MSANNTEDSGIPLPIIASIEPLPDLHLRVSWAEGERAGRVDDVDLSPMINTLKIYRPLRNNADLFQRAHLTEGGYAVAWDDNDLEMSAEAIEQLADIMMSPKEFDTFLKIHSFTHESFGQMFGYSRRQVFNFTKTGPIPRIVAWACRGYEMERRMAHWKRELELTAEYQLPEQPPLPRPRVKAKTTA